jgi:uncharacterized protein
MIKREIEAQMQAQTHKGKAIVLVGPKQVGKTTLLKKIVGNSEYLFLDGNDPTVRNLLANTNTE